MRPKLILVLLFILSFNLFGLASAFLISDQGASVRNLTGSLLETGNLTISIYDNPTAGNTIFSSAIQNAIVNGSWNLMISPNLNYGVIYWKDYEINGEDLDFDGNERLEFQSSIGLMNNVSFINFSLINSCPTGSAIRSIYSNGSVECETDDSGNSSAVDLTNYALKNQSETFSGNITTSQTGFFGWLGSLTSRITKLFVNDIDASGDVNVTGNVTATYFKGDGSLLTNLPAGSEADPIFVAENSSLWSVINSKLSQSDQRYNDTALIVSVNRTTNIMSLGFYNKTEVDNLISVIGSGNLSFNQSLTDALYYSIANPLGFINYTLASVYNDTSFILTTNSSLWNYINSNFGNWSSTFNSTYNSLLGVQCPIGYFVNGTLNNGTLTCMSSTLSESDPLWTANSTSVLYLSNLPLENKTISHISNITGFSFNYNQTAPASIYTNSVNSTIVSWVDTVFAKIVNVFNRAEIQNQYYNKTEIGSFGYVNSSSLQSYNDTALINSVNQTLSSIKLDVADQRYNETILILSVNTTSNIMSLSFYNKSEISALISGIGNSSFNQSLTDILYYSINNPLNFINHTQASVYNDTSLILNVNSTIWTYINSNFGNWNATFNLTYNNLLGQQCPVGKVVNGTLNNGTLSCVTGSTGSVNIFDQVLNTTSNATFANITVSSNSAFSGNVSASTGFFSFLGSLTNRITKLFAMDLDVSNNISVAGNVSAQFYFGSLNSSTFPISSCSGTDKVTGVNANGSISCSTDNTAASAVTVKTQRVDVITTSGTLWNFTNLGFDVLSSKNYTLICDILYTGSAATVGQAINLSTTAATTDVTIAYDTWSSATAKVGFSATSFGTALTGTGSGAGVIKPNLIIADFRTTGAGTVNLSMRSEVDTSATTLKRGSMCNLYDVTNSA